MTNNTLETIDRVREFLKFGCGPTTVVMEKIRREIACIDTALSYFITSDNDTQKQIHLIKENEVVIRELQKLKEDLFYFYNHCIEIQKK